jgi:fructoselysine-6-P-deglycase FrlB-like protein
MTTRTPTQTAQEVASQPDVWARVLAEAAATSELLPASGAPVLAIGCGTSYYIAQSYERRRLAAGRGRTRAAVASEIPYVDAEDTLLLLSRSGTTTDVIRAAQQLKTGRHVVGVVGVADTPVAELCDEVVVLDYADEKSIIQTRFATSAMLALRASLGEDLAGLPDQARAALTLTLPTPLPTHTVFLGSGWTVGLASEAALKCREAAGAWTEAYPVMEYPHGPVSAAGPTSLIWSFEPLPDFVRAGVTATGATVFAPELDPLAQLVAVHRLALQLAEAVGRDPDTPPHLTRSVQLP